MAIREPATQSVLETKKYSFWDGMQVANAILAK
jgi:hypothetical protein